MINFLISLLARLAILMSRVFISIFLGITGSAAWLLGFLKLDKLPEPTKMILKMFFWGALIIFPVFVIEFSGNFLLNKMTLPPLIVSIIYWFLIIGLVEEFFKYLLVKIKILKNPAFDEPVDAVIYMIVVALGFAALENILYLLPPVEKALTFSELFIRTAAISFFRFLGATLLHSLCSALVGFFLALSIYKKEKRARLIASGLLTVTLLHGLYNFSIIEIEEPLKFVIPVIILFGLTLFLVFAFWKLKKMKSVCQV